MNARGSSAVLGFKLLLIKQHNWMLLPEQADKSSHEMEKLS